MGWNSTHLRAVQTTTRLVVEICRQMEEWRRLLRHIERLQRDEHSTDRSPMAAVASFTARGSKAVYDQRLASGSIDASGGAYE